jgi:hypothetical protein
MDDPMSLTNLQGWIAKTAAPLPTSTCYSIRALTELFKGFAGGMCRALSPMIKPKVAPLRKSHVESQTPFSRMRADRAATAIMWAC